MAAASGISNYVYCGDGPVPSSQHNDNLRFQRGIFGMFNWVGFRDILDGTSNTLAISEAVRPRSVRSFGIIACNSLGSTPLNCRAVYDTSARAYPDSVGVCGDVPRGYRWTDGAAWFAGFSTALPPNSPSCGSGCDHQTLTLAAASSYHPGGVVGAMADGSVRFFSDTIDTGTLGAAYPSITTTGPSPYGVWGALGTRAGGEPAASGN
jgi:prepilin-type processing-associated H-X9-DG protein